MPAGRVVDGAGGVNTRRPRASTALARRPIVTSMTQPPEEESAPGAGDPIERWGRRIGRALGLIAVVALSVYLYLTYLR